MSAILRINEERRAARRSMRRRAIARKRERERGGRGGGDYAGRLFDKGSNTATAREGEDDTG